MAGLRQDSTGKHILLANEQDKEKYGYRIGAVKMKKGITKYTNFSEVLISLQTQELFKQQYYWVLYNNGETNKDKKRITYN